MTRELPDIFACCDCAAPLDALDICRECERRFDRADACPVLFPTRSRDVSFTIAPGMLRPDDIAADSVFRYPARSGQDKSDAYHLDLAHQDILENLPAGSVVLEIGCGGGQMRAWLRGRGLVYVGTDVSTERVHDWLTAFGGPDILCDAHALPVRDASVDVVYAAAVWEHLAFPQMAAREVARVLRTGGYFLGSASFLEPWHDESYYHMTPNGTHSTLRLAGLETVHVWPEVKWPGFVAMLEMGNKATRPVRWLGRLMNVYYLLPKQMKIFLKTRTWPDKNGLFETRSRMAGAIAWIARKPLAPQAPEGEAN